ncbi:hypothetical protein Bpfe_000681 [Biomphalaria pfeifferi]|uniref:Transmembrane protein n=1 Tax=Biomphalaria pfeifferi TaxID=112525 RepID=A0AAD8CBZ4_BIOPF|nr:hypothetical protein Bpfe_000681 [Biomphalaria pfeifferi]
MDATFYVFLVSLNLTSFLGNTELIDGPSGNTGETTDIAKNDYITSTKSKRTPRSSDDDMESYGSSSPWKTISLIALLIMALVSVGLTFSKSLTRASVDERKSFSSTTRRVSSPTDPVPRQSSSSLRKLTARFSIKSLLSHSPKHSTINQAASRSSTQV